MKRHVTRTAAETEALGSALGATLGPGAVLGLSGVLGAGKTAFVRGLVRGVGSGARVHSPTFALMNEYPGGRCMVRHMDLYRLGNASAVRGAGLEEHLLRPDGITVVEWIERWDEPLPGLRRIRFRWIDEGTREVTYDDLPCT